MKAIILGFIAFVGVSGVAVAGQPDRPGAFGRDRAACIQTTTPACAAVLDTGEPGHSEWGHLASERAGTNGELNQAYKDANGGTPTHGND